MSEHVALALAPLAEIVADTTASALARVVACGLLLEHQRVGGDDPTALRFSFTLADGELPPDALPD